MQYLDWSRTAQMPWRQRNAAIEAALRKFLNERDAKLLPMSTIDLAGWLIGGPDYDKRHGAKLAQVLSRMAPYFPQYATHDGELIRRYGKQWRRWQWHGSKNQSVVIDTAQI